MIAELNKNPTFMFLKAFRNSESIFVRSDDEFAKQIFKNRCENRDLWVLPNLYTASSLSAKQICPLRFHIVAENLTQARRNAIEACYYITQNFAIQEEGVEVIYNGGKGPVGSMDNKTFQGINDSTTIFLLIALSIYTGCALCLCALTILGCILKMLRPKKEKSNGDK